MSYTAEEKKAIAGTLLNQIGSKALVMIGARNFGYATDKKENVYVSFRVGRNEPRIAFVKITYNAGTDLYDIEYMNRGGEVIDSDENFYGDQLATALGHHLKMAVSLGAEEKTKEMILDLGHNPDGTKKTALIPVKKFFNYIGEIYAVHPDAFYYLNSEDLTISTKYFAVSHYSTGEKIISSCKTIKEAIEKAQSRITSVINERGQEWYDELIKGHKVLNPFPAKF